MQAGLDARAVWLRPYGLGGAMHAAQGSTPWHGSIPRPWHAGSSAVRALEPMHGGQHWTPSPWAAVSYQATEVRLHGGLWHPHSSRPVRPFRSPPHPGGQSPASHFWTRLPPPPRLLAPYQALWPQRLKPTDQRPPTPLAPPPPPPRMLLAPLPRSATHNWSSLPARLAPCPRARPPTPTPDPGQWHCTALPHP